MRADPVAPEKLVAAGRQLERRLELHRAYVRCALFGHSTRIGWVAIERRRRGWTMIAYCDGRRVRVRRTERRVIGRPAKQLMKLMEDAPRGHVCRVDFTVAPRDSPVAMDPEHVQDAVQLTVAITERYAELIADPRIEEIWGQADDGLRLVTRYVMAADPPEGRFVHTSWRRPDNRPRVPAGSQFQITREGVRVSLPSRGRAMMRELLSWPGTSPLSGI